MCSRLDFVRFCNTGLWLVKDSGYFTCLKRIPERDNRSRVFHHNKIADGVVTVTSLEMKNHRSVCSSAVSSLMV
jgi:hypothetical protein